MRYLIIEYEVDGKHFQLGSDVRQLMEKDYKASVSFVGDYPDKETAQNCSVIRERLISNEQNSNSKFT